VNVSSRSAFTTRLDRIGIDLEFGFLRAFSARDSQSRVDVCSVHWTCLKNGVIGKFGPPIVR
jgi:hypothetical protein